MSQEELEKLADNMNISNKPIKKKRGLFGFFKKNKKMVEKTNEDNQKTNEVQQAPPVEEATSPVEESKSIEEVKQEIQNTKEELKVAEKDCDDALERVENDVKETINEDPVLKEINKGNEQQMLNRIKSRQSFNEKADYKIATFQIKVQNKDVGAVLTKLGAYADELNKLEQVEHCDLTIVDKD